MANNAEQLLDIYNELDNYLRNNIGDSHGLSHKDLINIAASDNKYIKNNKEALMMMANLRNLIIHNPYPEIDPITEPNHEVILKYREIKNAVLNPRRAEEVAVKRDKIFTASLTDNTFSVMKVMMDRGFSHVPIFQRGKLFGVFSESVIFNFLVRHNLTGIHQKSIINDFIDFLPIDQHQNESFMFIPKDTSLSDVDDMFRSNLHQNKRLAVIYMTLRGRSSEEIIGMITPWNIAGE